MNIMVLITISILLTNCSEKTSLSDVNNAPLGNHDYPISTPTYIVPNDLIGKWGTECLSNGVQSQYVEANYFADGRYEMNETLYADPECKKPFLVNLAKGRFGQNINDSSSNPENLDYYDIRNYLTIYGPQEVIDFYNNIHFCFFSDPIFSNNWENGKTLNVTNRKCFNVTRDGYLNEVYDFRLSYYTVYSVQEGDLYLGYGTLSSTNGFSPDRRNDQFDVNFPLKKIE